MEVLVNGSHDWFYNSAPEAGSECIAAFKPKAATIPIQSDHYKYIGRHKKQKTENILAASFIR